MGSHLVSAIAQGPRFSSCPRSALTGRVLGPHRDFVPTLGLPSALAGMCGTASAGLRSKPLSGTFALLDSSLLDPSLQPPSSSCSPACSSCSPACSSCSPVSSSCSPRAAPAAPRCNASCVCGGRGGEEKSGVFCQHWEVNPVQHNQSHPCPGRERRQPRL